MDKKKQTRKGKRGKRGKRKSKDGKERHEGCKERATILAGERFDCDTKTDIEMAGDVQDAGRSDRRNRNKNTFTK